MLNNRFFQDINEGMELPEDTHGPITRQQLIDYASSSGDYNKLHYDDGFAKQAGLEGCIAHGMLIMALVGSYILNISTGAVLRNFKIQFTGMTKVNDIITFKGKVAKKYQVYEDNIVEIEILTETQDNRITTKSLAVLTLPIE